MEMLGEDVLVLPVRSEDETNVVQAGKLAFGSSTLTAQAEGGQGCTVPAGSSSVQQIQLPATQSASGEDTVCYPCRLSRLGRAALGRAVSLAQHYSVSCNLQKDLWSPDPRMGTRIQPKGNISCQEHEQGASKLHPISSHTSSGRRQTKPQLYSIPFPLTAASGRQHESRNILAAEGGGFFPAPLYRPICL